MSVEFENDYRPIASPSTPQFSVQGGFRQSQSSGMTGWLLKKGIIKDESQAHGILLGIVVINIIATIFVIYYFVF